MPTENGTSSSAERLSIEEIFTVTLRSLEKDHQPPYEDVFRDRMNRLCTFTFSNTLSYSMLWPVLLWYVV